MNEQKMRVLLLCTLFVASFNASCVENGSIFDQELPSQLVSDANAVFQTEVRSIWKIESFNVDFEPNVRFLEEGYVTLTFVSENSAFKHQLGVFQFLEDSIAKKITVFEDSNCLQLGDSVRVGPFQAGENIGFFLTAVDRNVPTIYSVDNFNANGFRQFAHFRDATSKIIVIGAEDTELPGGDRDYNDVVFAVSVDGSFDDSTIYNGCWPSCGNNRHCRLTEGGSQCEGEGQPEVDLCSGEIKNPFGDVVSQFNVFVFEDFQAKQSNTRGRLAAGGTVRLESYSVGCGILQSNNNCIQLGQVSCQAIQDSGEWVDTLVSGGNVVWRNGQLRAGNLVFEGSSNLTNIQLVQDCGARQASVIDFEAQRAHMLDVSQMIREAQPTGSVIKEYGKLTLKGSGSKVEVFEVTAAELQAAVSVTTKDILEKGSVVINVKGTAATAQNYQLSNFNPSTAIWNFYEANTLTFKNIFWQGSILAPHAEILESTGTVVGHVIARSWKGSWQGTSMEQQPATFKGCIPSNKESPTPINTQCTDNCVDELLGATYFNGFFHKGFQCVDSSVQGRLAAGGDVWIKQMGIANCLLLDHYSDEECKRYFDCDALGDIRTSLVSDANILGLDNNGIGSGDVIYSQSRTKTSLNSANCNFVKQNKYIDFDHEFAWLKTLSRNLASINATGTVNDDYGVLQFVGNNARGLEIFEIDESQLVMATSAELLDIKPGATVLINVKGDVVNVGNFGFQGNWPSRHVLWNLNEASCITMLQVGWKGTILAPNASFNQPKGSVDGQVIATEWIGGNTACMAIREQPFIGCVPDFC